MEIEEDNITQWKKGVGYEFQDNINKMRLFSCYMMD